MKSAGRIGRKKTSRPFKDFHAEWTDSLRSTLLPLLRHSMSISSSSNPTPTISRHLGAAAMLSSSDLLSTHAATLHSHFQAYYQALDLASHSDVSQLLSPDWRSPLEKPFLWFADFHPSLFTNLLRSLSLDNGGIVAKIEQIERGIRLIVPTINQRFRDAQVCFVEIVAGEWAATKKDRGGEIGEEVIKGQMEEMESVFGDANRLRSSILGEIVGAADVYQGALFLEALSEFVVGLRDPDLVQEFEQCKIQLSP